MYERSRPRVRQGTKPPSQPLPWRPEQASLAKAEASQQSTQSTGHDAGEDPAFGISGVYIISVAARILEMHPQTLRKYERLGLINPGRTLGMLRLYSREDIRKVRLIQRLGNMGLNLAGIEFALGAAENLHHLNRRLQALVEDSDLKDHIEMEVEALLHSLHLSVED